MILLAFTWGSRALPPEGFRQSFIIRKDAGSTKRLPVAHTCEFSLDLPEYSAKETLEARLRRAILLYPIVAAWGALPFIPGRGHMLIRSNLLPSSISSEETVNMVLHFEPKSGTVAGPLLHSTLRINEAGLAIHPRGEPDTECPRCVAASQRWLRV